jgi:hypothetical protein
VGVVGGGEHDAALGADCGGGAVVDVGGGVQAQAAVPMLVVIPGEKDLAVSPGGLDGGEATGEVGPVFQCLELGFAKRVVVADVRAGCVTG